MQTTEYRMHKPARVSLYIAGVLCMLLVVTIPIGIWIIVRAAGAKVLVSPREVRAKALLGTTIQLADVTRVGRLLVKIQAAGGGIGGGIGKALAQQKVGGTHATNLCVMTKGGKTIKFVASQFENHEQMAEQISKLTGKPIETVEMGFFSPKWPKQSA